MFNPIATYRLQFHKEFSFDDFERIISYLQQLGISTVYASPIFAATPGSVHGYDGISPHRINPEIGTEDQLKSISKTLKENNINWLQDIVPNHMAYHPQNKWLMDVLEKGRKSIYASFFDIGWDNKNCQERIMAPFLGVSLKEALEKKEIKVQYEHNRFVLKYYDNTYPLNANSYYTILQEEDNQTPQAIKEWLSRGQAATDVAEWDNIRDELSALAKHAEVETYIKACIEIINNNQERLQQITDSQFYRLCHWQETDKQINYRRFFTINGLICLNIQDKEVFQYYHELINALVREGIFQGLRIDHIDGLFDPTDYLEQLRLLAGEDTYIVVEKILGQNEVLPEYWPIQGNTGYDFLAMVNNLFTNKNCEKRFTQFYQQLINDTTSLHQQQNDKKAYILHEYMSGELDNLYQFFSESGIVEENTLVHIQYNDLKRAIGEFLIQCPVYRYYGNNFPLNNEDANCVQDILNRIKESKLELIPAVEVLETVLLKKPQEHIKEYNDKVAHFYQRCMQFAGPLMAKGVEDTLMYTYNRFIGHNEVGDSPEAFGYTVEAFHRKMLFRQKNWPLSINTTATHDTKRGEDVRARLNVLTDMGEEWLQTVEKWLQVNTKIKSNNFPDINDEYFIYQTLAGAYPMLESEEADFSDRIQAYLQKAVREAKTHSNWAAPNQEYENAIKSFINDLLDKSRPFWKSFKKLHDKIVDFGISNSLAQVLLKFTCPGIPDIYQGTEFWDLSFVDPDNRRAVDYEQRRARLNEIVADEKDMQALWKKLWDNRYDGGIKLCLIHCLLNERKQQPDLFVKGYYIPLRVEGKYKEHVFAFARRYEQTWYVTAVPLYLYKMSKQQKKSIEALDWKDTHIVLPPEAPEEWEHLLLKTKGKKSKRIEVKEIFKDLPFALLKLKQPITERSAGILLAITSLSSPYGVGDIGPEAKAFAGFLSRSCQKYWQLLPINPTEMKSGHSPYSSISSMAGNTLLLSPDLLVKAKLLTAAEIKHHLPPKDKADYADAESLKQTLFETAYQNFKKGNFISLRRQLQHFCEDEAHWLDDFSLFVVLKQQSGNKPWHEWPDQYKKRDQQALSRFKEEHADAINKVKWLQLLFSLQWKELKTSCNNLGIQLFGDLPFYVSYNSADVWVNPEIFCLDEDGAMTGIAGVPPDYFSKDGQLWNMPTYRWDVLKEQGYKWWINRLRKNLQHYDMLRLDHFRALADYWQVPAGEETARNGKWIKGPGTKFFEAIRNELGDVPIIAEDLGYEMDKVYELRDKVKLPGMKVLQFAFGEGLPGSVDIPHNYRTNFVVYTGTHDNNTTLGWYRHETKKDDRKRLDQYVGYKVHEKNVPLVLAKVAYASVAKIAILPMQDILCLDETKRMNTPASDNGNWLWRLKPGQITTSIEKMLRDLARFYNRA